VGVVRRFEVGWTMFDLEDKDEATLTVSLKA